MTKKLHPMKKSINKLEREQMQYLKLVLKVIAENYHSSLHKDQITTLSVAEANESNSPTGMH